MQPLIVLNTVGLTANHLCHAPNLKALADSGWTRTLCEVLPAVTCTAQSSMLTGKLAEGHGIVGNGWFWRETGEIRFWMQSNNLLQSEPVYHTARLRAQQRQKPFRSAKLFWWFNQGANVDWSVTPKPHYGADGNKLFDIAGTPVGLTEFLKSDLGPFPFQTFWGPMAGLPCTQWISACANKLISKERPELTLVYLPHLDYETQRKGPNFCDWSRLVRELDEACSPILEAARKVGAAVWVVNEYGHIQVSQPIFLNRVLRQGRILDVREGPFGEMLDTFTSRAFAVCDHQLAHVYLKNRGDVQTVRDLIAQQEGVDRVLADEEREEIGLNHPRAGDIVVLSKPDSWFAYPYWMEDRRAPDFARTVNIHAKPGYDPCELFFDPELWWPQGRAMLRLIQKKMGFRTLFDVIPLDAHLVKGSHGLAVENSGNRPLMIGDGPSPNAGSIPMVHVRDLILQRLGLGE